MIRQGSFKLTPLGYQIVQNSDYLQSSSNYYKQFGHYKGVDRLPMFIAPDPGIRKQLGEPPIEDIALKEAIETWFSVREENQYFFPDFDQVQRLLTVFCSRGLPLEFVFIHLAWNEGDKGRVLAYKPFAQPLPSGLGDYGFDVSWPNCEHSAIVQPGIVPADPIWKGRLNEWGLLDSYDMALKLRSEYLSLYPYPPFDVFFVSGTGQGEE